MKNKYSNNSNSSTQIEEEKEADKETVVYKKIETSTSYVFTHLFFSHTKTRMSFYNITSSTQKKKKF